jgi:UDPglucose 6-dehydrogenase
MRHHIAVIGAGVVGTATGQGFLRHGHSVTFVDVSESRVSELQAQGLHAVERLSLDDRPTWVFLTLPTPDDGRRWDLGRFVAGVRSVGEALGRAPAYVTVVVRSTVPPGTCNDVVRPILEDASGMRVGGGFALASNPEFLRARCADEDFLHPWMTVLASRSRRTQERLAELLRPFGGELHCFDDPTTAELIKCSHNLYNAAKISFWNELWMVGQRLDVDMRDVAATVARSAEGSFNVEYGITGGAPYGGACLPKDTKGFLGFAEELGVRMPLLEAVDQVNETMRVVHDGGAHHSLVDLPSQREPERAMVDGRGRPAR